MGSAAKALVLQGGGALGAYQAGVCEALLESDGTLDWVAGVSIGAINAALIAGNPPGAARRAAAGILGTGVLRPVPERAPGTGATVAQ